MVDLTQRDSQSTSPFQSLDQVAIFTTTGDVPDAVAKKLGSDESGRQLAEHIITTTNGSTSTIAITAAEPTADEAARLPTRSRPSWPRCSTRRGRTRTPTARDKLQARLDDLNNQINDADRADRGQPAERRHSSRRSAARSEPVHRSPTTRTPQLAAQGPPTSRFQTLQKAQAVPDRQGRVRRPA